MKTIVFIRQTAIYYDSRALKTIQTLAKKHRVIVLGWDRDGFGNEKLKQMNIQNVDYYLFNKKMPHGSGKKAFPVMLQFFYWTKKMLSNLGKIDYVHCCDLDGVIGCFYYIKKNKIPLIYDIYDYYIESHTGIPKLLKFIIQKMENKVIEKAKITILCTEQRIKQISKAKPQKIVIIHNTPEINVTNTKTKLTTNKYKLCFIGALTENRLLLEIAKTIKFYPEFEITFGGNGELAFKLRELADKSNQINFLGTLEYKNVLEYESKCDLLFAAYSPNIPNHKFSAPNKIYEAMALQKPILVCKGTGIDELVLKEKIGEAIPYDANEFFKSARKLLNNKELLLQISSNCIKAYEEKYSWKIMSERLFRIYGED